MGVSECLRTHVRMHPPTWEQGCLKKAFCVAQDTNFVSCDLKCRQACAVSDSRMHGVLLRTQAQCGNASAGNMLCSPPRGGACVEAWVVAGSWPVGSSSTCVLTRAEACWSHPDTPPQSSELPKRVACCCRRGLRPAPLRVGAGVVNKRSVQERNGQGSWSQIRAQESLQRARGSMMCQLQ